MGVTIKVNGPNLSLSHKGSNGFAKNTLPDVCKTPSPGGPVPVPYPVIISRSGDLKNGTKTVKADGNNMIAVKGSEFSRCMGDEPGTAGGVVSSTNMKEAKWITYSFDVKMDGKNACRFTDKMTMNHGNTVCLAGLLQIPVSGAPEQLKDIAKCCNKAVDCGADYKGKGCRSRGVHKHSCCQKAIERKKAKGHWKNVEPESPHPKTKTMDAIRLDVQIKTNGKTSHIYDFKFNCSKEPTMSDRQKQKYRKRFTGAKVSMIGAKGAKKAPPSKQACAGAPKPDTC